MCEFILRDEIKVLYLPRFLGIALKRQGEIVENCMPKSDMVSFSLGCRVWDL